MKKLLKKLSKALYAILVCAIVCVAVACGAAKNKTASPAINVDITEAEPNSNTNEATNVSEDNQNNANDETNASENNSNLSMQPNQIELLSGIYKFEKTNYSFADIYFKDLNELLDFFGTHDLNGVYYTVAPLGFNDFTNQLTIDDNNRFNMFYVDETESKMYLGKYDDNNTYEIIEELTELIYNNDEGIIETPALGNKVLIESSNNGDTLTYSKMFIYTDANGNSVETPLYIKATLNRVDGTTDVLDESNSYRYINNSLNIKGTNVNAIENSKTILAELFGVDANSTTIYADIESILANWKLNFNEDYSRIIFYSDANDGNYFIVNENNGSFDLNGITINFNSYVANTSVEALEFTITLNDTTTLLFRISK
ncbi:MAG: hypothetical protein IJ538_04715 [Clostridia bacterium]|nr:hypothetical protein [Clostridia bacterium]